ncbi:hypothetical protein PISL3812_02524 [Talaromyces islandicus]|uniref:MYND-type domain-containing protein n=1 Tax=Talaromyces islandicus TaxID=28573 RepID=A0A0U1LQH2_TALIS|nr:hypothetical protein PISL3812_02524 [Talaromyces islandicus]
MDIINNKLFMLKKANTTTSPNQQQQQYLQGNPSRICNSCKKREPWNAQPNQKLKRCSRCRSRLYCSRTCQRSDWKSGHRRACSATSKSSEDENGTETDRKRIVKDEEEGHSYYLGNLSEEETMNRLIDAYRLRVEDERIYRGYLRGRYAPTGDTHAAADIETETETETKTKPETEINASLQSALRDFQDFLDLAETFPSSSSSSSSASPPSSSSSPSSTSSAPSTSCSSTESKPQPGEPGSESETETKSSSTLLPSWWTPQKRAECERRALQSGFWSSLCAPVNKDAIVDRYRDSMMPMKLRVLAEAVYGYNVMDQPR